ncbi:hypothetical protein LZG37_19975 [Halomonas titanicae]|uniref:hypothetical protein n=1 Tax=Vreelandella titanicae TaxID=664683 RepID=UPI001F245A2D|nr:hypothetical protein [Halomonas titanicae]MCE7520422.1 hypothetical protein [Halomonas titanicae]
MWWEKTVEYMFVITYMNRDALMAPLDGNYEAGADLMARHNDRWVLIEFKRNAQAIDDEIQKFAEPSLDSFERAKAALAYKDSHHLLIFGERGDSQPMELKALSYFRHQSVDPKEALGSGVAQEQFNSYLSAFLYFKFGEVEEGSGGRSLDYSTVVAVNSDGEITHCEGLANYCEHMNLGPDLTPVLGPTSNPGFGMGGPS